MRDKIISRVACKFRCKDVTRAPVCVYIILYYKTVWISFFFFFPRIYPTPLPTLSDVVPESINTMNESQT